MSKLRTLPYAVLAGSLLAGGSAYAQSMYSIDQRQDHQQDRIERGIRSGEITRSEAYRLEQGERAIDRAQSRARSDGVVTSQERARIDRMTDRQGREIYRQGHDNQQSWDRGQRWGSTDGHRDGWHDRGGRQSGWGQNNGGDRGQHYGWTRGEHNGWDGNRPPGVERRDGWNNQRVHNGTHDGSLTRGEAGRLQHNQNGIDRYQARARSDGRVSPYEHGRIDQMQNNQSQRIYNARHNERTQSTAPAQQPSHNWGNGGWRTQQAGMTQSAPRQQQPQQTAGNGGWRMQQASVTPQAPRQQTSGSGGARMQQASAPAAPRPAATAPSGGQRTRSR
jgi:hypothetical protein